MRSKVKSSWPCYLKLLFKNYLILEIILFYEDKWWNKRNKPVNNCLEIMESESCGDFIEEYGHCQQIREIFYLIN